MSSEKASFYSKDPVSGISDKLHGVKEESAATQNKASFYARDPTPVTSDTSKPSRKKYMGQERRRKNRRTALDRRSDVRFDLTKSERRQSLGRRENDATVKFWS
jgi:hypothetical protein